MESGHEALELVVEAESAGSRVDHWLASRLPGVSRRRAQWLAAEGLVRDASGRPLAKGARVEAGARVHVWESAAAQRPLEAEAADDPAVRTAYEDEDLIVLDKPPGWPSVPLRPGERGTIANVLAARFPETGRLDPVERGLLQRLDRGTSGLVAAARTPEAFARLVAARRSGAFAKSYLALVRGTPSAGLVVRAPLGPGAGGRVRVREHGRAAESEVVSVTPLPGAPFEAGLVAVATRSGARHQVRVHLAHAGHPLLGDLDYGGPELPGLRRHALHAAGLRLPGAAGPVEVESPLPEDLRTLVDNWGSGD